MREGVLNRKNMVFHFIINKCGKTCCWNDVRLLQWSQTVHTCFTSSKGVFTYFSLFISPL